MDYRVKKSKKISDGRGDLFVFLKKSELVTTSQSFGQIYLVTFKRKGTIRGNHYHHMWREWFGVIEGKLAVTLEDVTTKERVEFVLAAHKDRSIRLEIGPGIAHTFTSLSDHAVLINYADREWQATDRVDYKLK